MDQVTMTPKEEAGRYYVSIPMEKRVESASEMIDEIIADQDRLYCLAEAIHVQLTPKEGEVSSDPSALALTELLTEMLGDKAQLVRLRSCLESMCSPLQ